jgi:BolA protein
MYDKIKTPEKIEEKIRKFFKVERFSIEDETHLHEGHKNWALKPGGHFKILVVSSDFASMNRVKRQQAIYKALEEEMKEEIHALSMSLKTPEEIQA